MVTSSIPKLPPFLFKLSPGGVYRNSIIFASFNTGHTILSIDTLFLLVLELIAWLFYYSIFFQLLVHFGRGLRSNNTSFLVLYARFP